MPSISPKPGQATWAVLAFTLLTMAGCGGSDSDSPDTEVSDNSSGSESGTGDSGSDDSGDSSAPEDTPEGLFREVERLNRGTVAVSTGSGNFVSWRLLGTEAPDTAFNLYRDDELVNSSQLIGATSFLDESGDRSDQYVIRPVIEGVEHEGSKPASVWQQQFLSVPLSPPESATTPDGVVYTYSPNDASVADLNGDGNYEIILKWNPSNAKDNSQSGYTGNVYVDAYTLDGTRLWRIDLGRNIRAGAHYTQFIAYDLDGDGKAEVAMKTADGTVDGRGTAIGDVSADHRNAGGYILSGPEFLTVFDGLTGEALATTDYIPERGNVADWGDDYGNRVDRFLAGVAYLDGEHPSLVMTRGQYTRIVLATWDWNGDDLSPRWVFDSDDAGNEQYAGQGAHSLTVGDVDQDGRDEIVFGAATIDDDGTGLYSTGLGHGDALHLADINPDVPGLEVFMPHEGPSDYGLHGTEVHDARTGEILWSLDGNGTDVGRGLTMDIDPNHPGYEAWSSSGGLYTADGYRITDRQPASANFAVWWDGDLLRELLDKELIEKWNPQTQETDRVLTAYQSNAKSNNGTKATPALSADILGDWREEVIWRHWNNKELLIFTTTAETDHRIYTLMHDTQYRAAVAWQNGGYNQPPHPSFYLGHDMADITQPDVRTADGIALLKPTGSSCESTGSETVSETIVISGGVFDGECKTFNPTAALGDGSQAEDQQAVFRLENGATLKNVIIGDNGADGIHVYNGGTVDNVLWTNVGEDALTVKSEGKVTLRNIEAYNGEDKFLQINAPTSLLVSNCIVDNMGKFLRQNGGSEFHMSVTVENCRISNMNEGVFRSDSPIARAYIANSRLDDAGQLCIGAWESCAASGTE